MRDGQRTCGQLGSWRLASRELLGNFPQAFSHLGLINAALALRGPE